MDKGTAILFELRIFISRETLRMLFFTFIQPHIDCDLLIWGEGTASNLKPVQSKLKEAIRKVSFQKNRHSAEPLFKQHRILNINHGTLYSCSTQLSSGALK